ncbi:MAG: hypothetical protein JWO94_1779 [Verrucomicrobiaceae bacterium]|nr:hypothetical protein [Verrucomicrobiaceae bacterium]
MSRPSSFFSLLLAALLASLLSGCAMMGGAVMEGATDSRAKGKVLRVTAEPVSLGYHRLGYHSQVYPGVAKFLRLKGYPDYLVEDSGLTSRQMVMFYLKPNQAYLFQMKEGFGGQSLKVTGPEPIGKKTRAVFDAIDRGIKPPPH